MTKPDNIEQWAWSEAKKILEDVPARAFGDDPTQQERDVEIAFQIMIAETLMEVYELEKIAIRKGAQIE